MQEEVIFDGHNRHFRASEPISFDADYPVIKPTIPFSNDIDNLDAEYNCFSGNQFEQVRYYKITVLLDGDTNELNYRHRIKGYRFQAFTDYEEHYEVKLTDEENTGLSRYIDKLLNEIFDEGDEWIKHIDWFEFENGTMVRGEYLYTVGLNHEILKLDWTWIKKFEALNDCDLASLRFIKSDGTEIYANPYAYEYRVPDSVTDLAEPWKDPEIPSTYYYRYDNYKCCPGLDNNSSKSFYMNGIETQGEYENRRILRNTNINNYSDSINKKGE